MRLFGDGEVGEDRVVVAWGEAGLLVGVARDAVREHLEALGGVPEQNRVYATERLVGFALL